MFLPLDGDGELYLQLRRALRSAVRDGRLLAGTRLPATRALAAELKLSRNTVLAAYELLCAEQLAVARSGSGTFVADALPRHRQQPRAEPVDAQSAYAARLRRLPPLPLPTRRSDLPIDFQYGEPMTHLALFTSWSRALTHAAARAQPGYPAPQGSLHLRAQIVAHLGRRRGVACEADDVVIVNGTQQAFSVLARVLLDEGDRVVVEEPGYALAKHCLMAHGAEVVAVPVGADGLEVARLPSAPPARMIVVTPSHQFPLGVTLSLPMRQALLQHAARNGSWIVEDDYDGEFGFEGRALPALRALDAGDRVIYIGTFSKTILPSLRLGYIVCPRSLRDDIVLAKRTMDVASSGIEQQALARFMASGAFDRHLKRTALELRRRRRALNDGLAAQCGERLVPQDSGTGMHLVAWLPGFDAAAVRRLIAKAEQRGLGLHSLAPHYESTPPMQALLIGYAATSVSQIHKATCLLGESLDAVTRLGRREHETAGAGGRPRLAGVRRVARSN